MTNFIIITSVCNPPELPLSYCNKRSIYTNIERYDQLLKTIKSVREKIVDSIIVLVECSEFLKSNENELITLVNDYINVYNNNTIKNSIYSPYKGWGESEQLIVGLTFIKNKYKCHGNIFKISGRYYFNDNFNINFYNNDKIICSKINNNISNINTRLYKLPSTMINEFIQHLENMKLLFMNGYGAEIIFAKFILNRLNDTVFLDVLGVSGTIAVSGEIIND